jgi:CHAT domain-containing protein
VLAVGDHDYGARVDGPRPRLAARAEQLVPLPASGLEAKAVGDVVLLKGNATETRLGKALQGRARWRALHLATHGLISSDRPLWSSLALAPDGESDGFLTAIEVFRMSTPADLVVLSACETARGDQMDAEGIYGLTRAFMFAGASSVLCSLWRVDDEATKALMVKFYELWNPEEGKGIGAAEALRRAQAFIRSHEKWAHPYFWAAWTLWGLPR